MLEPLSSEIPKYTEPVPEAEIKTQTAELQKPAETEAPQLNPDARIDREIQEIADEAPAAQHETGQVNELPEASYEITDLAGLEFQLTRIGANAKANVADITTANEALTEIFKKRQETK